MKDCKENKLNIGDEVVYIEMWGRDPQLKTGKVVAYTPKGIVLEVEYLDNTGQIVKMAHNMRCSNRLNYSTKVMKL